MNIRTRRKRITAAVVGVLTVAALGFSAAPASAKMSDGYVRGYDTYKGDWGDEGTLGMHIASNGNSNAVCLWQKILWAEGAEESNGTAFDQSDIDGQFGNNTRHATEDLSHRWLGWLKERPDVNNELFGRADNQLEYKSGSDGRGRTLTLRYNGSAHNTTMTRNSEGKYGFYDGDGVKRTAGYDYNSCD
jgi:hypothetical protein